MSSSKSVANKAIYSKVCEAKFELSCVLTRGVCKDKHFGYSIPVELDDESAERIEDSVQEHGTKSPLYGGKNVLYLKVSDLTPKQKEELLDGGRSHIMIHFTLKGVNTARNDVKYLSFKVTKLRKVEKSDTDADDSRTED